MNPLNAIRDAGKKSAIAMNNDTALSRFHHSWAIKAIRLEDIPQQAFNEFNKAYKENRVI